jgi:hypothetical protein
MRVPGFNIVYLILLASTGILLYSCAKEYSFEGGRQPVRTDTIINQPPPPPTYFCAACTGQDKYVENRWSFYESNLFFCGIIDTAIAAPQRSGFTFYGPSACSPDSGAVFTVTFENGIRLDRDMINITTPRCAFYYYDNPGQSFLYMNILNVPFHFTIEEYIHQTKMLKGTFTGPVRNGTGGGRQISSGKFMVRLL